MDFSLDNLWGFIRTNFFYDFRSTVISLCVIVAAFFFIRLLKDNGEKVVKSMRYLICIAICITVVMIKY